MLRIVATYRLVQITIQTIGMNFELDQYIRKICFRIILNVFV